MRINKLSIAVLGLASMMWGANKGPDAANYTATDATVYSFIDLAGGGGAASVLSGTDDGVALLTLPFSFQFYGHSYTLVCASSNGLLTFVSSASACAPGVDFANTDLTATATPGDTPAVLPYWSDLTFQVAGAGALYYQTQGAAGSRRFVVEWTNAYVQGSANPVTFEAVLYEGSNKMLFQYQTVDLGAGNPATRGALATVGIRDGGGNANGRQIAWSYNAAVLGNSSAILFTPPGGGPPPVNTITTVPAGLTVSIDGVAYTTPKTVNWTPGSPHTLAVTSPMVNGGTRYTMTQWSTGAGTAQISVTAGTSGTTYTANFRAEYQLTTVTNPPGVGSVTGAGWYASGTGAQVRATAPANYIFSFFSGDLSGAQNPQSLTMNGPKNVSANFQSTANPVLIAVVAGKSDGASPGQRVWTLRVNNTGLGAANAAQITSLVLTQLAGTACSPAASVATTVPVALGAIGAGANATGQVTLNFAGCDATARFALRVGLGANGGTYSGSATINNQSK